MAGSAETEAPKLAEELGCTLYEARLRVVGPKPLILLQTDDKEKATTLVAALSARQHAAVAVDTREVPADDTLVQMDHFRLTSSGVELVDGRHQLAYDEVTALVPAVHRRQVPSESVGDDLLGTTAPPDSATAREERVHVLYLYPRNTRLQPPWILQETSHLAGPAVAMGRFPSFRLVSEQLRGACTRASWDERLRHANPPLEPSSVRVADAASTNVRAVGILAFALARWLVVGRDNPYRD